MFHSVIQLVTHAAAAMGSAVAHSPQTWVDAVMCALTASLFN